jgi:hypothetical protein
MSHLSSDQLSMLAIGDAAPQHAQHAAACAECARELARLKEALTAFQGAVREWTNQSGGDVVPSDLFLEAEAPVFTRSALSWTAAVAALILLVFIPAYRSVTHLRQVHAEDALLLEQVNAHLSRSVATPIEPLMDLMSDAEEIGDRQ